MEKILTELCHEVNNYFKRSIHTGTFSVVNGALTNMPSNVQEGQYIRIVGSVFNDGVHKYKASGMGLTNENEFKGAVWLLAIPQEFVSLSEEVSAWVTKYGGADSAALSPFNSESFAGYSYSKGSATSSNGKEVNPNSWQSLYGDRLAKFRRIRGIV